MRTITFLSSALLLATPALAQVSGAGVTTTEIKASATCGTNSKSDSEKKDTKFSRGIGVAASYRYCSSAHGGASIHSSMNHWTRQYTTSANASASASVWGKDASSKGSANVGDKSGNGIQFTLSADSDTKGKLTVRLGGGASDKQTASASVTVGNETLNWKAGEKPVSKSWDITVGKSGFAIDTTTLADAALDGKGRASAHASVSISFVSEKSGGGKCEIKDGVAGCGPELKGSATSSFRGHNLTLDLSKAAAGGIGLRAWSKDGKTFDLGGCPIFMELGPLAAFIVDDKGNATQNVRLPRGDYKLFVQNIVLSLTPSVAVKSSNSLEITCSK
jgi:hypothetical protein